MPKPDIDGRANSMCRQGLFSAKTQHFSSSSQNSSLHDPPANPFEFLNPISMACCSTAATQLDRTSGHDLHCLGFAPIKGAGGAHAISARANAWDAEPHTRVDERRVSRVGTRNERVILLWVQRTVEPHQSRAGQTQDFRLGSARQSDPQRVLRVRREEFMVNRIQILDSDRLIDADEVDFGGAPRVIRKRSRPLMPTSSWPCRTKRRWTS